LVKRNRQAIELKGGIGVPNYPRKAKNDAQFAPESLGNQLPRLTVKQARFVNAILAGKSNREAYRLAFNCNNMKQISIDANASKLLANTKIALCIRSIQRMGFEQASITRESHLTELARMRELAVENQQISAGVQAEHYRGRVAGLYNDKLSLTVGPSDEALLAQLANMLGESTTKLIEQALAPVGEDIDSPPVLLSKSEIDQ
jgi:hypothetical protein